MNDPALPKNNDDLTPAPTEPFREPDQPTGLGWREFFQDLGQGPNAVELSSAEQEPTSVQERMLYASENGDCWSLVRVLDSGRVVVRHRPNVPSGGQITDMDVGDFLSRGGMGPEKQELLRLIGGLVENPEGHA